VGKELTIFFLHFTFLQRNNFAEIFKNLARYRFENNFVKLLRRTLKHKSNDAKNVDILATNLSVLHNYFDSLTKLFLNLCLNF